MARKDLSDRTVQALESARREVPKIGTISELRALLTEINSLVLRQQNLAEEIQPRIKQAQRLRDTLLAEMGASTNTIRALIEQRRAIMRDRIAPLRYGETQEARDKSIKKRIDSALRRAQNVFGVRVNIKELESLAIRNRKLTARELSIVRNVGIEAQAILGHLKDLRRQNRRILTRVIPARRQFEKFAGINYGRIRGAADINMEVRTSVTRALRDIQHLDRRVKENDLRLGIAATSMQAIANEAGRVRPGTTLKDAKGVLNKLSAIGITAGILTVVAAGTASPVAGALIALGVFSRLLAVVVQKIRDIKRRIMGRAA